MFVCGVRGRSNPYVVRWDGTGLQKLADLGGYQGRILFLDVPDHLLHRVLATEMIRSGPFRNGVLLMPSRCTGRMISLVRDLFC